VAIKFDTILTTENLAAKLSEDELAVIAGNVVKGFTDDVESRRPWTDKMEGAFKLALQVMEEKSYPWPKASNVKFPLITVGALQFSARAYPALINGGNLVKTKIIGDHTEKKIERANRISRHMSHQILTEDEDWEEEMDRLLLAVPIVGCSFKKTYFDPQKKRNCSVHVLAKDLVVNYWAKSVETASRKTHRFYLEQRDVISRQRAGVYRECELGQSMRFPDSLDAAKDEAQGVTPTEDGPREILEQHTYLDLDEDGYTEPYIVTLDRSSQKVVRIVKRFESVNVVREENKIISIKANEYFTKYGFIPSPDGGFYDLGWGVLLGPISHSIDSLINQLVDSGTLSNMQSGFLGRGIRMRRGEVRFKPGEWKNVDSTGDDIRKNVFPVPVREPSQTLFQLLGLLIEYGERISSVTDIMSGISPGQNQPATTTMALLEQGQKVFTGVFKRIHRGMRSEFRKLYELNQIYLDPKTEYHSDGMKEIFQVDYIDANEIIPASDPNSASDAEKLMQAEALAQRSAMIPGYDRYEVEKRLLSAMRIEDVESVFPDPKGPNAPQPQPDPKMLELKMKEDQAKAKALTDLASLYVEASKTEAEIALLEAQAVNQLADAESKEAGTQMGQYQNYLAGMKSRRESILEIIKSMSNERDRVPSMEGPAPDQNVLPLPPGAV